MLNLRTYGLKIHYNTTAEGSIDWVGEQISWKGSMQFTMDQLREMIGGLIRETREVLFHDLMLIQSEAEIPVIPWSSLRDNPLPLIPDPLLWATWAGGPEKAFRRQTPSG